MKKELISHEIAEDSIHFSAFSAKHGIYYSVETFFAFYAFSKKKKKPRTQTCQKTEELGCFKPLEGPSNPLKTPVLVNMYISHFDPHHKPLFYW